MAIRKRIIKRGTSEEVLAELDADIAEYVKLRSTRDDAEESRKELGQKILETLEDNGLDKYKGVNGSVSVARPIDSTVDPMKLKRRIGNTLWNRITDRTINQAKLDAYVKSGDIKLTDVVAATSETPRTPYVTVTAK